MQNFWGPLLPVKWRTGITTNEEIKHIPKREDCRCTQRFNPKVEKMEKSPSGSVTHEVGEAPYWQPTGAGDELQQPHPLLVVHLLYELQEEKKKEKEGKNHPINTRQ